MELTPLRYFQTIASARHITRAAQRLGVTQPALSAAVKKLEAELGVELLHRTGRGVDLTDAGRAFLRHAEEALRAADAAGKAARSIAGLEAGSIRVGGGATAMTYLLPPVVSAVRQHHPGLVFFFREAGSAVVADAVHSGELDLGIVTLPPKGARKDTWTLPGASDLHVLPLVTDELRLIMPPGVALEPTPSHRTGRKPVGNRFSWGQVEGHPFVAFEAGTAVRAIIDQSAEAAGVRLNVVMELRSIESIKRMVEAGIGVGMVSRFALRPDEGLGCHHGPIARRLALVRRADRKPSPAAAEFEKALTALVAGLPGRTGDAQ